MNCSRRQLKKVLDNEGFFNGIGYDWFNQR